MEHSSSHQYIHGNQNYQTTNQLNPLSNNLGAGINAPTENAFIQNNDFSSKNF